MAQVRVERLDHLGLIASVIKDLGLIDDQHTSHARCARDDHAG